MDYRFSPPDYDSYYDKEFRHRWLKPQFLVEKLNVYAEIEGVDIDVLGTSTLGQDIHRIRWGGGDKKIFMWSQMHGNEPTATLAIVDLLSFLSKSDEYDYLRSFLHDNISLTIIPMLNPDGAQKFTRRNAMNVDINRDAQAQKTKEMQILVAEAKAFKPHWAFNLHDQRNIYTVGATSKSATISFLSPSIEHTRKLTPTREESMRMIGGLHEVIQDLYPGHSGRYSDEYYPRAVGEYFQQQEVPCVLIESGAYTGDPGRDVARKLNFLCLLEAFRYVAEGIIEELPKDSYFKIPENQKNRLDIVIRNCHFKNADRLEKFDLGFLLNEKPNLDSGELDLELSLAEIGDLSFHYGYEEITGGELLSGIESLVLDKPANLKVQGHEATIEIENGQLK